jgi:copper chaperone CopZ
MNKKLVTTRIGNVYGVQKTEVQNLDNITQPTELVVVVVAQNLDNITVKQLLTI